MAVDFYSQALWDSVHPIVTRDTSTSLLVLFTKEDLYNVIAANDASSYPAEEGHIHLPFGPLNEGGFT